MSASSLIPSACDFPSATVGIALAGAQTPRVLNDAAPLASLIQAPESSICGRTVARGLRPLALSIVVLCVSACSDRPRLNGIVIENLGDTAIASVAVKDADGKIVVPEYRTPIPSTNAASVDFLPDVPCNRSIEIKFDDGVVKDYPSDICYFTIVHAFETTEVASSKEAEANSCCSFYPQGEEGTGEKAINDHWTENNEYIPDNSQQTEAQSIGTIANAVAQIAQSRQIAAAQRQQVASEGANNRAVALNEQEQLQADQYNERLQQQRALQAEAVARQAQQQEASAAQQVAPMDTNTNTTSYQAEPTQSQIDANSIRSAPPFDSCITLHDMGYQNPLGWVITYTNSCPVVFQTDVACPGGPRIGHTGLAPTPSDGSAWAFTNCSEQGRPQIWLRYVSDMNGNPL